MEQTGKLVVFEGPRGAGKTTLARGLAAKLAGQGVPCDYFSFPGSEEGSFGQLVHQIHHRPAALGISGGIDPTGLQLLHVAAHIDGLHRQILPALAAGRVVILDRFWWSTWVYGILTGADARSLNEMISLEKLHWGEILPWRIFLLKRCARTEAQTTYSAPEEREYLRLAERLELGGAVRHLINDRAVIAMVEEIEKDLAADGLPSQTPTAAGSQAPTSSLRRHVPTFSKSAPAKPTIVYDTYWSFATERQEIFFRRLTGRTPPWTDDRILSAYKFTNAYRASDRVSQYLIRRVIYRGEQTAAELFFRIMLFKLFNKIETWELLEKSFGELRFNEYRFSHYDSVLRTAIQAGNPIYSAAYIMPSGGTQSSGNKHSMHLQLVERMMRDDLPQRVVDAVSMREVFEMLVAYPTIGPFLAYQYAIDLNYSALLNFSEMDFVVPGPGAKDGMRKCFRDFGGLTEAEIVKVVADTQEREFEKRGLAFKSLWGRPLQLVDCQNLFCEVDKYARLRHPEFSGLTGRTRIKQRFRAASGRLSVWYPPRWNLNDRISSGAI